MWRHTAAVCSSSLIPQSPCLFMLTPVSSVALMKHVICNRSSGVTPTTPSVAQCVQTCKDQTAAVPPPVRAHRFNDIKLAGVAVILCSIFFIL